MHSDPEGVHLWFLLRTPERNAELCKTLLNLSVGGGGPSASSLCSHPFSSILLLFTKASVPLPSSLPHSLHCPPPFLHFPLLSFPSFPRMKPSVSQKLRRTLLQPMQIKRQYLGTPWNCACCTRAWVWMSAGGSAECHFLWPGPQVTISCSSSLADRAQKSSLDLFITA